MESDLLVLAIDIGTSSARVIAFDSEGRAVDGARAQEGYSLRTDPPGAAELDADAVVETVARCVDSVLRSLGERAGGIRGVGCCTFWHSMVGVDSAGKAITPLYTWADTRSAAAAKKLHTQLNRIEVHRRTGCAIHPSYFPARLAWLRESDRNAFRQVARWLSPGEYLFEKLFGRSACSVSMASATGLYDQNLRKWDTEMLAASGITEETLAPLTDIDQPESGLSTEWSSRWPALKQVPWVPAIGDGAAGNLGSDCSTAESVAINLGTSGAIRVLWESEKIGIPPELWCYRLDSRRFVVGAAFSDGGEVYSWMRRALDLSGTDDDLNDELLTRSPDSHGLTFLPFLAGERSIGWRPDARATLHGISIATTPIDILQASMEGVALRFLLIWEMIHTYFPDVKKIVASGGAIGGSKAWQRMLANSLGHPILVTGESEASSRGAAILALQAAGIIRNPAELPTSTGRVVEHEPKAHETYRQALQRQQELYSRLGRLSPETHLQDFR